MEKKKAFALMVAIIAVSAVATLPFWAHTGAYPLSIVDGNSMYPNLQNGDLVYFSGVNNQRIPNGTIIVFVQGETGISLLDGLVRPVVIHRIIGEVIQSDGTVYYETKGDNNDAKDPFLTKPDNILGVATQNIPKIGLLFLFLKSPQGLIATVGIISLGYLSLQENKRTEEKKTQKLLGALAKNVLNGDISDEQFKKLELVIKYSGDFKDSFLEDKNALALQDWLKKGGLEQKWTIKTIACTTCRGKAIKFEGAKNNSAEICYRCSEVKRLMNQKGICQIEA
jgi:signal peptidase I